MDIGAEKQLPTTRLAISNSRRLCIFAGILLLKWIFASFLLVCRLPATSGCVGLL